MCCFLENYRVWGHLSMQRCFTGVQDLKKSLKTDRIYGPSRLKCEENTCLIKGFLAQMLCLLSRSFNEYELNRWQTKNLTKPDTEEIQWLWSHRPRRLPGAYSDGGGGEKRGLEFHTQPSSSGTRRWNSQMKGRSSFECRWWTSP